MESLRFHLVRTVARFAGHRHLYRMDTARLEAWLEKNLAWRNNVVRFAPPFEIEKKYAAHTEVFVNRPAYVLSGRADSREGPALLFLHGGGFIMEADPVHWRAAKKIIEALGITVWFPAYPLLSGKPAEGQSGSSMRGIAEMVFSVYERMLETREPNARIAVMGDSAGAALALALLHHIKNSGNSLPMPCHATLISPAQPVETNPETLRAMREIDKSGADIMLSLSYMKTLAELCGMDGNADNYIDSPLYGNFSGFPPIDLWAGTADIVFPQAEALAARAKKDGAEIVFHRGKNMMHVWPLLPFAPECTSALDEIIGTLGRVLSGGDGEKKS